VGWTEVLLSVDSVVEEALMKTRRDVWMVYVTAANAKEAASIGTTAVRERLAACVNVLGAVRSVYWWGGRVCRGREIAFVAKTSAGRVEALVRRMRELHSYETPCIVAWPIRAGNPDFLAWVREETR